MTFKTLLAVTGTDKGMADVDMAIQLAEEIGAHLSVLVVGFAAPPPIGEYAAIISDAWMEERAGDIETLEARRDDINKRVARSDLKFDVDGLYCETVGADQRIGERARYADLTIMGAQALADPILKRHALDGALFESARPVLLIPKNAKATLKPKAILLAWDARIEAARALGCAMPVLLSAQEVHVTMIDPNEATGEDGGEPGANLATYLARAGAKIQLDTVASAARSTDVVLNRHAAEFGADMIVMGAYGHSRLRERIFGGVTRDMINSAKISLFMAH